MGGDLGGAVPQKPEAEGRPMHSSPNISRSSVIGCIAKYELTKKRCHEGMLCSETEVFGKKRVIYVT